MPQYCGNAASAHTHQACAVHALNPVRADVFCAALLALRDANVTSADG